MTIFIMSSICFCWAADGAGAVGCFCAAEGAGAAAFLSCAIATTAASMVRATTVQTMRFIFSSPFGNRVLGSGRREETPALTLMGFLDGGNSSTPSRHSQGRQQRE